MQAFETLAELLRRHDISAEKLDENGATFDYESVALTSRTFGAAFKMKYNRPHPTLHTPILTGELSQWTLQWYWIFNNAKLIWRAKNIP